MTTLRGIFPAVITPFKADGAVDIIGLEAMTDFLLRAKVHGLHPCGTTGEAPLLNTQERRLVADTIIKRTAGRVPVIIQVGHMSATTAISLARHAVDAGADAISVVTPYYYPLPESALLTYFSAVASAVPDDFPVYLYNIPQCTVNPVSPELLAKTMDKHPNVVGIKHSRSDLDWLASYMTATSGKAQVFVGSDTVALPGLALGAVGVVSGNANVIPEAFVHLYRAVQDNNLERARELQKHITHVALALGNGGSLASFKAFAAERGVAISSRVREPLALLSDAEQGVVSQTLAYAKQHLPLA